MRVGLLGFVCAYQFATSPNTTNAIKFQVEGERKERRDVPTAPRFARLLSCWYIPSLFAWGVRYIFILIYVLASTGANARPV